MVMYKTQNLMGRGNLLSNSKKMHNSLWNKAINNKTLASENLS